MTSSEKKGDVSSLYPSGSTEQKVLEYSQLVSSDAPLTPIFREAFIPFATVIGVFGVMALILAVFS